MAGLVNLNSKTVTLQGYQLTDQTAMMAALDYLGNGNYTGQVQLSKNGSGAKVYTLSILSAGNSSSQQGNVGDWVIIQNNAIAKIVTNTDFNNLYTLA